MTVGDAGMLMHTHDCANPEQCSVCNENVALVRLCLSTLREFEFSQMPLLPFVQSCIVRYLEHTDCSVRREAATTCAKLLMPKGAPRRRRGPTAEIVQHVLGQLLTVGVSDANADVRFVVVKSLDTPFDMFLAQPEFLRPLLIALNDEEFDIRRQAVAILRRLSACNPAYVLPPLRRLLIQLLTELQFSQDMRTREESVRSLGQILCASKQLVKCYLRPIITALQPKLEAASVSLATATLETLGELCRVVGADMLPYVGQLLPLVIEMLNTTSIRMRTVALSTLGYLVGFKTFEI